MAIVIRILKHRTKMTFALICLMYCVSTFVVSDVNIVHLCNTPLLMYLNITPGRTTV